MKIAYVTSRYPFPVEKGDKLRAYHQLKGLSEVHEVHLFALTVDHVSEEQINALSDICASVNVFELKRWKIPFNVALGVLNGLPFQVAYFFDSGLKEQMQSAIIRLQPDHIVAQLIRTSEYVRNLPFDKSIDYMDTFSFGAKQRSMAGPLLMRPVYGLEHRLVTKYEQHIYAAFDHHYIISEQDRDRLPLPYPKSVKVIPNGVDTAYYTERDTGAAKWDILFVGNMGYRPNVEAAEFLVRRVMPLVWNEAPDATVGLAGARPSPLVKRLAGKRVVVTGWVDDIRNCYASSSVFAAPMFSGMGLQNKILEAMAMGTPSVTTSIVNNAIGAEPGKEIAVANSAPEMAHMILRLLRDRATAESIAKAARTFVVRRYDWGVQNKHLLNLISEQEEIPEQVTI